MEKCDVPSTDAEYFSMKRLRNLTQTRTIRTVAKCVAGIFVAICILATLILVVQFRQRCDQKIANLTEQVNQLAELLQVTKPGYAHPMEGPATERKIAFSVASKRNFAPSWKSVIPMEIETYNHGNHFDMSTNQFTAPMTGVYAFFFGAGGDSGRKAWIFVRKSGNGSSRDIARAYDYSSQGDFGSASGAVIVRVNTGEHVSLWAYGSTNRMWRIHGDMTYAPSTLFSGYLIYKLE